MRTVIEYFRKGLMTGCSLLLVSGAHASASEEINPADWGLRNGCISNMNIKRVHFDSRSTGIIELTGNRKLKITLRNGCSGIRTEGYVHKPINHRFCEGDILRVINYGSTCVVDKLEPFIEAKPGEAKQDESKPNEEKGVDKLKADGPEATDGSGDNP